MIFVWIIVGLIFGFATNGEPNTIELRILPNLGDQFAVTTWNDTAQQDLATLVFYGPVEDAKTIIINEPYDSTLYSSTPGSPVEWSLTDNIINVERAKIK